jgi:hypothetical protein
LINMPNADIPIHTDVTPPALVFWGLQPATFLFVYWCATGLFPLINTYAGLLIAFVALSIAEEVWPARWDWKQTWQERLACLAMFALSIAAMSLWED